MNTALTWQTDCTSLDATLALAAQIGHRLHGGEVIELAGDLGSGKTAFVRGLARGLGSQDTVRSPSFTLSNQYRAGQLTLYHFDFYRLAEPGIMADELAEVMSEPDSVVVVEWADIIEDVLPAEHVTIHLKTTAENSRRLTCSYPETSSYLFPNT